MFWVILEKARQLESCSSSSYPQRLSRILTTQTQPPDVLYKKDILRMFKIQPAILLKKRLWQACHFIKKKTHKCFPVNFSKFSKAPIYKTPPWRLFLSSAKVAFLERLLDVYEMFQLYNPQRSMSINGFFGVFSIRRAQEVLTFIFLMLLTIVRLRFIHVNYKTL